jgi:hypothetical protein
MDRDAEQRVHEELDVALALGLGAARLTVTAARPVLHAAAGLLRRARSVVGGPDDHPRMRRLAAEGEQIRFRLERLAVDEVRVLLRRIVAAALTAIDLTELIRAHVDLDAVAADLDVDAVIARADIDAAIKRTDLNAIATLIDLDAIVRRVDLDAIVGRVDVARVIDRVDLDAIVGRVDVEKVIDRVDIDRIASRIDLDPIMARVEPDSVVARVDVEAVLARLDLAGIARQVIDAIDLPGILRQSTGAVSSQAARVVRTEGMHADESVARFMDRVLRRPHPQTS